MGLQLFAPLHEFFFDCKCFSLENYPCSFALSLSKSLSHTEELGHFMISHSGEKRVAWGEKLETSLNPLSLYFRILIITIAMQLYTKKLGLIRDKRVTAEILSLDPLKDHCRIVYLMTGYEFPWDVVRALEVALMRTFCSPRISSLLHRTGEFRKHGQKRYDDTALLVAEFMQNGYDDERGSFAITHMNMIHGHYKIENEDFLFVLSTMIFLPIQWIDTYGWRKTSYNERQALYYFFKVVGERMNIRNIPDSLEAFQTFVEDYERKYFVCTDTNHAVGNATINIVKGWMPFFAKPFVLPVMKCLLDERMLAALGYTKPSPALKTVVNAAMRLRALSLRKITFKNYPTFVSTEKNRTYPKGYEIRQLGPDNIIRKAARS